MLSKQSFYYYFPILSLQSNLIVASVTGVFRERGERNALIRAFQRVFVIVPSSTGFCIVNEQLHVTSATPEQVKSAFKGTLILGNKFHAIY